MLTHLLLLFEYIPGGAAPLQDGCGTVMYMAPELVDKSVKTHGYPVDWWALGCVLYELLVGVLYALAHEQAEQLGVTPEGFAAGFGGPGARRMRRAPPGSSRSGCGRSPTGAGACTTTSSGTSRSPPFSRSGRPPSPA